MGILIFASNNLHKLDEVRAILNNTVTVKSLSEAEIVEEIPETGNTLEENAFIKANHVYRKINSGCFADDTGLFVDSLNGMPGVFSARFAGENCSFRDNIDKLILLLKDKENRKASFKTIICLIENGNEKYFDGTIKGTISHSPRGTKGFGYDAVFIPDGFEKTFAELTAEEKNSLSHRAIAVERMKEYLSQQQVKR
ncbi:MAG: RdgB/HAM1 family non-canonical purine NTP pyrophosphatase [Bacteroidia bacterium]|nr:RdgB/HAM1 family non-canonical purine NTP pyrophosphatase [Bacteroidia bacterium]